MITKKHTYSYLYSFTQFFYLVMSLISILISLFLAYGFVTSVLRGDELNISVLIKYLILFLAFSVWTPLVFLFIAYLMTNIEVDESGAGIIVLWKRYFIKWGEMVEIKPLRIFGFIKKNSSVVVVTSKLTFFHRLYGLIYGGVNKPAILIHRNISDYGILIRNISIEVAKNKRSKSNG